MHQNKSLQPFSSVEHLTYFVARIYVVCLSLLIAFSRVLFPDADEPIIDLFENVSMFAGISVGILPRRIYRFDIIRLIAVAFSISGIGAQGMLIWVNLGEPFALNWRLIGAHIFFIIIFAILLWEAGNKRHKVSE